MPPRPKHIKCAHLIPSLFDIYLKCLKGNQAVPVIARIPPGRDASFKTYRSVQVISLAAFLSSEYDVCSAYAYTVRFPVLVIASRSLVFLILECFLLDFYPHRMFSK